MAGLFDRVERLLERVVEEPTRRLFRTRLQPVELARALGRAMEAEALVGPNGLVVPNQYTIRLNDRDYEAFKGWRPSLERNLARFVAQRALSRGWTCTGTPVVQVVSDDAVPVGQPRVAFAAVEVESPAASVSAAADADGLERTAVLTAPRAATVRVAAGSASGWLELADGRRVRVSPPLFRLGRAPDNDLVLEDGSVSRYHATIETIGDRYRLVDLGSHNGTRVGQVPVREHALRDDDVIHLGAVPLRFRSRP